MKRGLLGSLISGAIVLAAPAAADAAVSVSLSGSTLTIQGTNLTGSVTVDYIQPVGQDFLRVSDAGGATAGSGCDQNGSGIAECDADPGDVTSIVLTAQAVAGSTMNGTVLTSVEPAVVTTLNGGSGNDVFTSAGGNDVLHGNSGANTLTGGDGNDTIDTGGTGNVNSQILTGGDGADTITGAGGNNIIVGGTDVVDSDDEGDTITGGPLIDTLDGAGGGDTINGLDDEDDITGGDGADIINAGPGDDGDSIANPVDGGAGNDTVNGDAGDDTLFGGENASNPQDTDTLNGGADDDLLVDGLGPDSFNGGSGTAGITNGDEVTFEDLAGSAVITADIDGQADDGPPAAGDNVGTDVEHLTGDSGADTLIGDADANRLDGGSGDDTLIGGAGTGADGGDQFVGGSNGSAGDAVLYEDRSDAIVADIDGVADDGGGGCPSGAGCEDDDIETSVENLSGGSGADTLTGSTGDNVINGGPGTAADVITGLGATDEATYLGRTEALVIDPGGGADDGAAGEADNINADVENLTGGSGDDRITGDSDANEMDGAGGNDTLAGGTTTGPSDGTDTFTGGGGTDDTADYSARTQDLSSTIGLTTVPVENDVIGADIENLTGGSGDDDLIGDNDANELTGNGGDDDLTGNTGTGSDGADTFSGGSDGTAGGINGAAGDLVRYDARTANVNVSIGGGLDGAGGCPSGAGCEDDSVGADVERVFSGDGDDTLTGGSTANQLSGAGGDDTIAGGSSSGPDGLDDLVGGGGANTLSYAARTDNLTITLNTTAPDGDTISGFQNVTGGSGNDVIRGDGAANTLRGGGGDDELRGGTSTGADGADTFIGGANGAAGDTANYSARTTAIDATIGSSVAPTDGDDVQGDIENLVGGSGNDILRGDLDPNVINGGGGDDLLLPSRNSTSADGGDTLIGGANGAGGDTATYLGRTDALTVTIGGGAGDGASGEGDDVQADVENLAGGDGPDTLVGDADANAFQGGAGDDVMAGGAGTGPDGADQFQGQAAGANGDTVTYATRTDAISADIAGGADDSDGDNLFSDIDNIAGGSGADTLTGSATANRITGGFGADTISALGGADAIFARDGVGDTIDCGDQTDTAELDLLPLDSPLTGCETEGRGQFTPPVDTPDPPVDQPLPPAQGKKCKKGQKRKVVKGKVKCLKKKRKKK